MNVLIVFIGAFSVEYTNNKKKTVKKEWMRKQEIQIV